MARATKAEALELDRDGWEYLTYAPGHECYACHRPIQSLEPVRRRVVDRTSGPPATVYRHNKCLSAQAVAA
ncbi:hypothetical protein ACGFXC_00945 [Streptomyces sp. NPDC048507]|uniref:hypothetical protein n=1 Tax=Streptomyces sp. NPDC048507 TaxID=3365560 RepID=UPI00371E8CF4